MTSLNGTQSRPNQPFVFTDLQRDILAALDCKALRTDAVAAKCDCDRSKLFKPGGIHELRGCGLVAHHHRVGYYRPDALPPDLADVLPFPDPPPPAPTDAPSPELLTHLAALTAAAVPLRVAIERAGVVVTLEVRTSDVPRRSGANGLERFVPTPFQEAILSALEGKALRTDALGAAVGDRSRLYKPGGIKELREQGLVGHHDRLGYYSLLAPPPRTGRPDGRGWR